MLWIDFSKSVLIFPKNFFNFRFDTVEKQSLINLNTDRSKSSASAVLRDFAVRFLREEDTAFCPFIVFCLYTALQNRRVIRFPYFPYIWRYYFVEICSSFDFNFRLSYALRLKTVLVCLVQLIFVMGLSVTLREFLCKFLKCSFHVCICSSWLAAFILFSKCSFVYSIYYLPCNSWWSIFYQVSCFIDLTLIVFFLFYVCNFSVF